MKTSAPTARGAAAGWRIAHVVMRTGWSVRVHDAHLVPPDGPVILAANHAGFLDAPLLMGTSLLVAALVVASGFATDLAYALLDPRVGLAGDAA